jgi:glutathione S-transferase
MIKVHHLENSRSQRILWLLEELETRYEVIRYERDRQTMLAPPELRKIHRLGKSPVIEDDGRVVAETGAVVEYILDRHGKGRLVPHAGTEEQPARRSICATATGSISPRGRR